MAELSYPTAGGGSVTDARYEQLIGSVIQSGLLGSPTLPGLVYADSTGRQVKVHPNRSAMVRGFRWESDGAGIVRAIAANASGQPRIDLAVLRLNRTDWTVTFQVLQGTPAATPAPPVLTQNPGPTGVWELPLAYITVPNGATTLAATAVRTVSWVIGPQPLTGTSDAFPPVVPGQIFTTTDTGRVYEALGTAYHLIGENGSRVQIPSASGWGQNFIYVARRNGWTYFQALVYWNTTTRAAGSDVTVCTLPDEYRPATGNIYCVGHHGNWTARFHVNGPTGVVSLIHSDQPLATGQFITIHPMTWLSK